MCLEIASCKDLINADCDPLTNSPLCAIHKYSIDLIESTLI